MRTPNDVHVAAVASAFALIVAATGCIDLTIRADAGVPADADGVAAGGDARIADDKRDAAEPVADAFTCTGWFCLPASLIGWNPGAAGAPSTGMPSTPSTIDLTQLGTIDWVHAGDRPAPTYKSTGARSLQLTAEGAEPHQSSRTAFTWSDGDPIVSSAGTYAGLRTTAAAGFTVDVAADPAVRRTLYLHLGALRGTGTLTISDGHRTSASTPFAGGAGVQETMVSIPVPPDVSPTRVTWAPAQLGAELALQAAALRAP